MRCSQDIFAGVTMAMSSLAAFTAVASMLQQAGMDFAAGFTACVLLSLTGTAIAAYCRQALVLTPSLTVTGYLVFIAAISHGLGWQVMLGISFLASLLGLLLWQLRDHFSAGNLPGIFPWGIKLALAVFLIWLGLKMGRIVITSAWQVTMLGDTADPLMFWSMAGIVLTVALLAGGWRSSLFAGMLVTGAVTFAEGFWVIPAAPFFLPEGLAKVVGQLSFTVNGDKESAFFFVTVLSLTVMLSALHGSTLAALARQDKLTGAMKGLFALGAVSALCGVPPLVISPASAAGRNAANPRYASLTALVILLVAMFCEPLIAALADFPALVVPVLVGSGFLLLTEALEDCPLAADEGQRRAELMMVSALVLLLTLTGNFATALGTGFLGYALFMTMAGKARQVAGIIWLISGIFALYFIYGSVF